MSRVPDFRDLCESACVKLWGEPDRRTAKELSWNGANSYEGKTFDRKKRVWFDRGAGWGGTTLDLVAHHKGLPKQELKGAAFYDAWRALHEMGGISDPPPPAKGNGQGGPILATYPYHDEHGELLFEVCRFDTADHLKRFRQRRPDGSGGFIWSTKGVARVLYRLPALIEAVKAGHRVLVCEGEKDANTAAALGYAATTMPEGVGKWRNEYDGFFRGADVVVVSDNDPQLRDKNTGELKFHPDGRPILPGQDHAANVTKHLCKVAARVRTIVVPQKDLSAWREAGGVTAALDALIEAAPVIAPENEPEPRKTAEIVWLAELPAFRYEQERRQAAKQLGVRASALDRLVKAERAGADEKKQGCAVLFPEPVPWPERVAGAALLDAVAKAIRRHVVLPEHACDVCALWVLHSYLLDKFNITPRLCVRSPMKGCGKTTLLDVLARLVLKPLPAANVTPAALFRVIEAHRPTLLIDEADTFLHDNDDLRGVLNAGHRKGFPVLRTVGDDHEPRAFATYGAVVISLIGALPETLHDRSITIELKRRLPSEKAEPFRLHRTAHLDELASKAMRWATDHAESIADVDAAVPAGIGNREADNWGPLLAIAQQCGHACSMRAWKAAEKAHAAVAMDEASTLELLLADIKTIFAEKAEIPSADVIRNLVEIEGRPWAEFGRSRKPLTQNKLARLLKPVGVFPKPIGPVDARLRGYVRDDFKEAFERYLGPEGVSSRPCVQKH
jgi:hypothetical protein